MSFLQLVLLLDKTIEGINSILPIVSYRNNEFLFEAKNKSVERITGDEVSILRKLIQNITGIVSNIFKNYSRRLPPNYPEPVQVRIGLYIKGKY